MMLEEMEMTMKSLRHQTGQINEANKLSTMNRDEHRKASTYHYGRYMDYAKKYNKLPDGADKDAAMLKAKTHKKRSKYHDNFIGGSEDKEHKGWFNSLSPDEKQHYLKLHPSSKYAKGSAKESKDIASNHNQLSEAQADKLYKSKSLKYHKGEDWSDHTADQHRSISSHHSEQARKAMNLASHAYGEASGKYDRIAKLHSNVANFHHDAAEHKDWFASLSPEQKAEYKKLHPKSKLENKSLKGHLFCEENISQGDIESFLSQFDDIDEFHQHDKETQEYLRDGKEALDKLQKIREGYPGGFEYIYPDAVAALKKEILRIKEYREAHLQHAPKYFKGIKSESKIMR